MPTPSPRRRLTTFAVAMAVLIATPLAVVATDRFTDVPNNNPHHNDITWLADAGVTLGCNPPANTNYCPDQPVRRDQMASFLKRLAENQVVHAATAIEAETAGDADALAGQGPEAYQTVVAYTGQGFATTPPQNVTAGSVIELSSVSITAPAAGTYLLQGMGTWQNADLTDSNIILWIERDTSTQCDSVFDGDALVGSVSEHNLLGSAGLATATINPMGASPAGGAGTATFYLCGHVQAAAATLFERAISVQWHPNGALDLSADTGSATTPSGSGLGEG